MKNGKNGSEFAAVDRRYKLVLAVLLLTGRRRLGKMRCSNSFVYYVFQPLSSAGSSCLKFWLIFWHTSMWSRYLIFWPGLLRSQ